MKLKDIQKLNAELFNCISQTCSGESIQWLKEKKASFGKNEGAQFLLTAFSQAPKVAGKGAMKGPVPSEIRKLLPGYSPEKLTADKAVRMFLILSYPAEDFTAYITAVKKIFAVADLNELVTLYSFLSLFSYPEEFLQIAYGGARSNMTGVFDAVALDNTYPCEHFSTQAYNQLVVKAAFLEKPLFKLVGLDGRFNPELSGMLYDFISERRAAGRSVNPALWKWIKPEDEKG